MSNPKRLPADDQPPQRRRPPWCTGPADNRHTLGLDQIVAADTVFAIAYYTAGARRRRRARRGRPVSGRHAGKVEYFPPEPPRQECPTPPPREPSWAAVLLAAIRGSGGSLSAILGHLAEVRAYRRWKAAEPYAGVILDERHGPIIDGEEWVAALAAGDDPFAWTDGPRSLSGALVMATAAHEHLPAELAGVPARQAHALLVTGLVIGYTRGLAAAAAGGRVPVRTARATLARLEHAMSGRAARIT